MSRQCPHVSLQSMPNDPFLQAKINENTNTL